MIEWLLILSALAASLFTLIDLGFGPWLAGLVGCALAVFLAGWGALAWFGRSGA